jgi:hypothetical protein
MRRLVGVVAVSGLLAASGAFACDDVAYNDSFAQMTKSGPSASEAKVKRDAERVAQRPDKRTTRGSQQAAPVKVATSPSSSKSDGASSN